jgi:hypothetical protein
MFAAILFVAIVAHAGASAVREMPGGVCACALRESTKTCYKLDRSNEATVDAEAKKNQTVKCVAFRCPAYFDCVEGSTTYCISQTSSKDKLVPVAGSYLRSPGKPLSVSDGTTTCKLQSADKADMKLTLYTNHPEEEDEGKKKERRKRRLVVKNFKFTFAGSGDW